MTKAGFNISAKKGFQITFRNGWTASVQFGLGNYCNNGFMMTKNSERGEGRLRTDDIDIAAPDCPNAEIAAFTGPDLDFSFHREDTWRSHWHRFSADAHDNIKGWVYPSEVVAFLQLVESFEPWKGDR